MNNKIYAKAKVNTFDKNDAYQTLSTIQNWTGNFDAKSSFGLTILGVLLGFTFKDGLPKSFARIAEVSKFSELSGGEILSALLVGGLYLASFWSLICLMLVLVARTNNPNKAMSLFFFGTISNTSLNNYKERLSCATNKDVLDDLEEQIHTTAKICMLKSKWHNRGIQALLVTAVLWFVGMLFNLM